jgi:hypothetical protein
LSRLVLVVGCAAVVAVIAAILLSGGNEDAPGGSTPAAGELTRSVLAADGGGVVMSDPRRHAIVGVHFGGRVAWRDRPAFAREPTVVCAASCPNAILSGSVESTNRPELPDPPVVIHRGSRVTRRMTSGLKDRVLWSGAHGESVRLVGDGDRARLLLTGQGAIDLGRQVITSFDVSANGLRALAVSVLASAGSVRRWFRRAGTGWRPLGGPKRSTALDGCMSTDGRRALLFGAQVALTSEGSGREQPVRGLTAEERQSAGACALGRASAAIAVLREHAGRRETSIVLLDREGAVRDRRRVSGFTPIAISERAGQLAYISHGTLHVVAPGRPDRVILRGVDDFAAVAPNRLAVVGSAGVRRVDF